MKSERDEINKKYRSGGFEAKDPQNVVERSCGCATEAETYLRVCEKHLTEIEHIGYIASV